MELFKSFKISIPNDINLITVVEDATGAYAEKIRFTVYDIHRIKLAVKEALMSIIKFGYADGRIDHIDLEVSNIPEGIRITINNHGLPVDKETIKQIENGFIPANFKDTIELRVLYKITDKLTIQAEGYKGNVILLEKHYPNQVHPDIHPVKLAVHEKTVIGKKIDYYCRLMHPDEAVDVSRLAYIAYNYSYIKEFIYIPGKVRELNSKGLFISSVAAIRRNEQIIAHTALILKETTSKYAEIASAFTDPDFRGHGCLDRLLAFQVEELAPKKGLSGVFAQAVTSHPYSQKALHRYELTDSALLVSGFRIVEFEGIEEKIMQRESLMVCLRIFTTERTYRVYLPQHHRKMITDILDKAGISYSLKNTPDAKNTNHATIVDSNYDKVNNSFRIRISSAYPKVYHDVMGLFKKSLEENIATISIFINIEDPAVPELCDQFEAHNFFFCGIIPDDQNLYLVLQYLNNQKYNYDALNIESEFGKKIFEYVRRNHTNPV